jgi:hypothetical protein
MLYKVNFNEGIVEFVRNRGRAFLEASDPAEAIRIARLLFEQMRDPNVQSLGDNQYLVSFKAALDYRLPIVKAIEKAVRRLRSRVTYDKARYVDRYCVASVYQETGKPGYLAELNIKNEISSLRRAAVVAREVPNVMSFIDYDICIHNYLELNNKDGFRSRVVRKIRPGKRA